MFYFSNFGDFGLTTLLEFGLMCVLLALLGDLLNSTFCIFYFIRISFPLFAFLKILVKSFSVVLFFLDVKSLYFVCFFDKLVAFN